MIQRRPNRNRAFGRCFVARARWARRGWKPCRPIYCPPYTEVVVESFFTCRGHP